MTIDEEIDLLSDNLRRLKVEYEVFFNGGAKKPPIDLHSRVESTLKKYSDTQKLSSHQRFRYNTLASKFAVFSDLWRKRMREREEGIAIGVRHLEVRESKTPASEARRKEEFLFKEVVVRPHGDRGRVIMLYEALKTCKEEFEKGAKVPPLSAFERFISDKTLQLVNSEHCEGVAYRIVLVDDQVRFQAVPVRK